MDTSGALARIVHPHLSHLHAIAKRILRDEDLAHDAVQEAIITLWRAGVVPERTRAWLVRTVIHRAMHERRTRVRRRRWEGEAAQAELDCPLCDPAREAENAELWAAITAAVDGLTAEHRDVFILRELDGLDYQAISERLNVPVGTVRSRLNRARGVLRDALRGQAVGA
jgi:RNA polymerase sigma-70 factor (ECF subfamily)